LYNVKKGAFHRTFIVRNIAMRKVLLIILMMVLFLPSAAKLHSIEKKKGEAPMEITVTSTVFSEGGKIPLRYGCDGEDISPPISWKQGPAGTKSYALISDDPDAPMGIWVHWVIYNIPASVTSLPENVPGQPKLVDGTLQGINDFKRHGYGGPCPPGGTHRYYFKVYALDEMLDVGPGLTKKKLLKALEGHVVASGELMGTYSR